MWSAENDGNSFIEEGKKVRRKMFIRINVG